MVKRQTFTFTVVFEEEETYARSGVQAISHELYNVDGILEWDWDEDDIKEEILNREDFSHLL